MGDVFGTELWCVSMFVDLVAELECPDPEKVIFRRGRFL